MKCQQRQLNQRLRDSVILRDIKQIEFLLENGADINGRDAEHNETPLILAVKFADVALVDLLLEAGAEVNARDDKGRTALFYVPVLSDKFNLLLLAGANLHIRDNEGNSVLMRKIYESASLAEVDELLRLGIDPNWQNESGETAIDLAKQLGLLKIVEHLQPS
jgi:ankyrin repeat protein